MHASTILEAIKAVSIQLPGFQPDPIRGHHRITIVGHETIEDLMTSEAEEIHIWPQLNGGKKGGFIQILIGAIAIAAAFIPGIGTFVSTALFSIGAGMVIGGIMQILSPTPKVDNDRDPEASKYLGSPKNTTKIGTRIPILYGTRKHYGHFISFDIQAKDVGLNS